MQRGVLLARGHVADVFASGAGAVLKLYRAGIPHAVAEREAANARAARAAGISTPAVIEVVAVEGRSGIVFERVEGPTMLEALVSQPAAAPELARQLADVQTEVHRRSVAGLPSIRERLGARIDRVDGIPDAVRAAAMTALAALPDGETLCHGDVHPGNVLLTAGGPVLIDWLDAGRGHAHADLARSSLVMRYAEAPGAAPNVVAAIRRQREVFHAAWLTRIRGDRPDAAAGVDVWTLVVAVARLAEPLAASERETLGRMVARLATGKEAPGVSSPDRL